jgi:large subunit ribosomal protein L13
MQRNTHTIDAEGKSLGRLATEVAVILRGKNKPEFVPHMDMGDFVVIKNVEKIKITGKKLEQKKYFHHSGYPGGIKEIVMGKLFEKSPSDVFKRTVEGMLPHNKLKREQIKRLKFE